MLLIKWKDSYFKINLEWHLTFRWRDNYVIELRVSLPGFYILVHLLFLIKNYLLRNTLFCFIRAHEKFHTNITKMLCYKLSLEGDFLYFIPIYTIVCCLINIWKIFSQIFLTNGLWTTNHHRNIFTRPLFFITSSYLIKYSSSKVLE